MSKIQDKFKINRDHDLSKRYKLIYIENRVEEKPWQDLEHCFSFNSIIFFTTINNVFNDLKDIFGNCHRKKYAIRKFRDLKIGARLFSNFYSKFIRLALNFECISKMLIWKFKHKLILYLKNQFNSGIKFPKIIFLLAKRCLSIYKQIQAIAWIKQKATSFTTVRSTANVCLKPVIGSF